VCSSDLEVISPQAKPQPNKHFETTVIGASLAIDRAPLPLLSSKVDERTTQTAE